MDIERIGTYQEVDAQGFLQSVGDAANIQGVWLEAVQALKRAYLERWSNVHSLYIRGSLAKGTPVAHVSDIDSFAVMEPDWDGAVTYHELKVWAEEVERDIRSAFPFVAGVEAGLEAYAGTLERDNPYTFILQTEAACIYGHDLASEVAPYQLGPQIAFQTKHFQQHLDLFLDEYPQEPEAEKADFIAWLMRRFLRLGMELVMLKEGRYTRDLYLCYESFAKHYPEHQEAMYRALELALNPEVNRETESFVEAFGGWLKGEAERYLVKTSANSER